MTGKIKLTHTLYAMRSPARGVPCKLWQWE